MSKASTPKTRLQRTSNPTPPEPESSKKYKIDMSQNNPEMDFDITPGSDKRTIIWRCLTTAAAFSSGLPTLCERMMLVIS
jgi:hypothetical protein